MARPRVDLLAGLIFAFAGAAGIWFTSVLPMGSLRAMGSAYLPAVVGWLLVGLGAVIALRGLVAGERMSRGAWRALAWLAGALVVFALSIERLGLPLATFATALLGARAGGDSDWRSGLAVGLVLALFCSALFVWLLGLNLRLMPAWIS